MLLVFFLTVVSPYRGADVVVEVILDKAAHNAGFAHTSVLHTYVHECILAVSKDNDSFIKIFSIPIMQDDEKCKIIEHHYVSQYFTIMYSHR